MSVGPSDLRAFLATGRQGVNYAKGVWHLLFFAIGLYPLDAVFAFHDAQFRGELHDDAVIEVAGFVMCFGSAHGFTS